MLSHLLHPAARVSERKILPLGPERQEVPIVRAAGLSGLARRAGRKSAVPVRQVEHLPVRRAVNLLEVLVMPGVVRRVDVSRTPYRAEVESLFVDRTQACERMS